MSDKVKCLSLMSGGRDSTLATAMMIEDNFDIIPFFCNNGHIEGEDRIIETLQLIDERYGTMIECNTVFAKNAMTLHEYMSRIWNDTFEYLTHGLANVNMAQIHCLTCRTSMFVHALAYCKARGIGHICDGMRRVEDFFANSPEYREAISSLAMEMAEVELHTPVYDYEDKHVIKRGLCDRNLPTKLLEPQCYLGCPICETPGEKQKSELMNFFNNELKPILSDEINALSQIYRIG